MIFNVKDNIIKENIFSIINMSSCHPQSENDHLKTNDFEIIFLNLKIYYHYFLFYSIIFPEKFLIFNISFNY